MPEKKNSKKAIKTVTTLPSNVEAERSVISAMLSDTSSLNQAYPVLSEDSFYETKNKYIFRAIKSLVEDRQNHRPVDLQTVYAELVNQKLEDAVGGIEYLSTIVDSYVVLDNVDHYVKIVKDQESLRALLNTMSKIRQRYSEETIDDIGDFIVKASEEISLIANSRQVGGFRTSEAVVKSVQMELDRKIVMSRQSDVTGLDTGFANINNYTNGWQPGNLIVIGARPAVGKTAFGMNLAFQAAKKNGKTVAFFSCEMPSEQIMERLLSMVSGVENEKIQRGAFVSQKEINRIAVAAADISKVHMVFDDTPNMMLGDLVAKATKLKEQDPDLSLIVIDYLGLIHVFAKPDPNARTQEVALVSGGLKQLARTLKIPVIVLAQLNRNVEDAPGKRPTLANLRESGSIEQDADIVMLIYRESYYTDMGTSINNPRKGQEPEVVQEGDRNKDIVPTSVIIAKNRAGRCGELKFMFAKSKSRFDVAAENETEATTGEAQAE